MAYTRVGWEDTPSEKTPLNAENLNHMDEAIENLDMGKLDNNGNASNTTATFEESEELQSLSSGAKLSTLFGVIAKAVSTVKSILSGETTVGNADKLGGLTPSSYVKQWSGYSNKDIKEFASDKALCPQGKITKARMYNPTSAPETSSDFIVEVDVIDTGFIIVNAKSSRTNNSYEMRQINGTWTDWKNTADGGNADKVDGYHASEFLEATTYPISTDCNTEITAKDAKVRIRRYNGDTLNSPYKAGVTSYSQGIVITYPFSSTYGTQLALLGGKIYVRQYINDSCTEWVSYLPLTGGTLSGSEIGLYNGRAKIKCTEGIFQTESINTAGSTANRRLFNLYNSSAETLANALKLVDIIDGVVKAYPILHSGNVGTYALPIGGGTLKGTLAIDTGESAKTLLIQYQGGTFIRNKVSDTEYTDLNLTKTKALFKKKTSTGLEEYEMLHTGNSAKVVISDTAPSDTSALWVS